MSQLRMLTPASGIDGVKRFVLDTVRAAGANPCPPMVLGIGIGGDFARGHQVDYVLGSWSDEERKALPERLKVFAGAVLSFATIGAERTMNLYNKR